MNRVLDQIRTKFIEYGFRAIAFTSGAVVLYALSQLRFLIK
jgi:hypothetical protein